MRRVGVHGRKTRPPKGVTASPTTTAAQIRAARRAIAWNMRELSHAERLTIEAASEQTDLSPRRWQKIEAGDANPTLVSIVKVTVAFRVELAVLFAPIRR